MSNLQRYWTDDVYPEKRRVYGIEVVLHADHLADRAADKATIERLRGDFIDASGIKADDFAKVRGDKGRDVAKIECPLGEARATIERLEGENRVYEEAIFHDNATIATLRGLLKWIETTHPGSSLADRIDAELRKGGE